MAKRLRLAFWAALWWLYLQRLDFDYRRTARQWRTIDTDLLK